MEALCGANFGFPKLKRLASPCLGKSALIKDVAKVAPDRHLAQHLLNCAVLQLVMTSQGRQL